MILLVSLSFVITKPQARRSAGGGTGGNAGGDADGKLHVAFTRGGRGEDHVAGVDYNALYDKKLARPETVDGSYRKSTLPEHSGVSVASDSDGVTSSVAGRQHPGRRPPAAASCWPATAVRVRCNEFRRLDLCERIL
eukprot:gene1093-4766_t